MHKKFDHKDIEQKWQQHWEASGIYDLKERKESTEKEYVLVEWPYPSGNLHIGHWHAFSVPDIYVRQQRMLGKQVLFPMGFDAFGLPAENAAIKRNINPREWTESNIAHMKNQLRSMGNAFSWNKTTSSTDPEYYKWTQWMFTQFFENDIAYRGKGIVNWCNSCNTVIANEQVHADNTCDRCGNEIEKKEMPQWMLRITKYADRLIDDLEALDWPEPIKEAQRRWIGRSRGAEIDFALSSGDTLTVFTTRPDTLYGVTYMVLAPEHPLVEKNKDSITNWEEIVRYIALSVQKDEQDRLNDTKEKTGVKLEGITATNPANGEEIPVYIADYVLASYGTGAIMAVPAHDERDYAFAKKFDIPIRQVVMPHRNLEGEDAVRNDAETIVRDVVDVIIEHPTNGTFLVIRERVNNERIDTHFVGGGTDGEDHRTAIEREVAEESGFKHFEIVAGPFGYNSCKGFRHSKQKNQYTTGPFYHIKLTDLEQIPSEVDQGLHEIAWLTKDEVTEELTWDGHKEGWYTFLHQSIYLAPGKLCNSDEFNGMDSEEAKEAIVQKVGGRMTSTYRLRDWSVGRQRYWGVPIPIVYDPEGKPHAIPKEHLPWTLPEDVDFRPTGEAPLAKSKELRERTEKIFGVGWTPEVETLDTFVDSSWYFLRYVDNHNENELSSKEAQSHWMPIDMYFGGAEHTTMHLLYSRFWQKALFDLGLVVHQEPYKRRINRGLILGPDGNKMSKSKGNVIDPDEQVTTVGADTVKMYLAFMGPYAETANYPWDMGGIAGLRRFLERINGLREHIKSEEPHETTKALHKTIDKVTADISAFKFNTAISSMMVYVNVVEKTGLTKDAYLTLLKLLAPFAPHLTEELWHEAGNSDSIHLESWPVADSSLLKDDVVTIGVQINGKLRDSITVAPDADEDAVLEVAKQSARIQTYLTGDIAKVIYVPGKILNLIVR